MKQNKLKFFCKIQNLLPLTCELEIFFKIFFPGIEDKIIPGGKKKNSFMKYIEKNNFGEKNTFPVSCFPCFFSRE